MVHGGEASDEDTADVLYILEVERFLGELSVGYLCIDHLIHRCRYRLLGEIREAA
jgi:hypothetical protein